ncbi:glycogen-binding subunit 76A [Caerostris extrusa]|uniref:Glycogen-binding subunit 76A n=1 Tax=Caerostris extrusa TaxID=172846 RepID=A0AAV4N469_CAEEX|nr:glycogen-binding subunit 76A [Caerostris extrusa]
MSVLSSRPSDIFTSSNRRRQWQTGIQRQQSFSLDFPQNIYDNDKLSRGLDSVCFTDEPLRCREEDRVFLYLPRNLSYCEVCSDVIRDHVQKKVRLLSNRLCQYEDVPPTPDDRRPIFGVGEESEDEYEDFKEEAKDEYKAWCTANFKLISANSLPDKKSILKRKVRAVSFPAPRKEGKKIVRFADALVPAFLPPSLSTAFIGRLKKLKVCLHSVSTADNTVYGIISVVVNVTFHKTVFVRYTANGWASYHDELATYLDGSSVDDTDKFSFTLFCNPSDLCTRGHSLFFAVCFETAEGRQYWDSNDGKNYCIKCEKREIPVVGSHSWVHFL